MTQGPSPLSDNKINWGTEFHTVTTRQTCPPYALDGRSEETEGDGTPQPVHGAAVGLVLVLSKGRRQTLVECGCFLAESTTA